MHSDFNKMNLKSSWSVAEIDNGEFFFLLNRGNSKCVLLRQKPDNVSDEKRG